jgi:hypothetical protein
VVSGNTFNVRIPLHEHGFLNTTAYIYNCYSVVVYNNTFAFKDPISSSTDLSLVDDPSDPVQSLLAYVENNVFNTSGTGVGLYISGPGQVMVQGNDFRHNAVGVYLVGDGTTVGTVDLGGGQFGSLGQNNFSTFTEAGVAKGHFAISLHNTAASDYVYAGYNIWSTSDDNLVKDGTVNTNATEAVYNGGTTGTGYIATVLISFSSPLPIDPQAVLLPSSVYEPQYAPDPAATVPPWVLDAVLADPTTYSGLPFVATDSPVPPVVL